MSKHSIFFKRITSAVISVSMLLPVISISASAETAGVSTAYVTPYAASASDSLIASGWSNSVYWQIDKDGLLTIKGTGDWERVQGHFEGGMPWVSPWCLYYESIKSAKVNLTGVTNAENMFFYCTEMTDVDLKGFDTSKVTNMRQMFQNCIKIKSIDLSGYEANNVTDARLGFSVGSNLEFIDLSTIDAQNITDMDFMIGYSKSINAPAPKIIKTPKNVNVDCELPATYYTPDGTAITSIPKNRSESITLTREKGKYYGKPVIAAAANQNTVTLRWAKVDGAEKYRVYKYEGGKLKKLKATKGTSAIIKDLAPDTNYQFAVRAYVNGKWTKVSKSDIVKIKTEVGNGSYKEIYKAFLLNILNNPEEYDREFRLHHYMFELFDVNSDGIPELFLSDGDAHASGVVVHTISNDKIVEICELGSNGLCSATTNGYLCGSGYGQGIWISYYYKMEGYTAVLEHEHVNCEEYEGSGRYSDDELYRIDGKYVSKETYYAARDRYNSMDWHNCLGRKYNLDIATVEEVFS